MLEIGEQRPVNGSKQILRAQWADDVVRGEDDIPARVPAKHPGEHFLIALIDAISDAHIVLRFEFGDGSRVDVIGPVEDVAPRAAIASAPSQGSASKQKWSPVHAFLARSEIRMSAPRPK